MLFSAFVHGPAAECLYSCSAADLMRLAYVLSCTNSFVTSVRRAGYPGASLIISVAGQASKHSSPDWRSRMGDSPAPLSVSYMSACQNVTLRGRN